MTAEIELNDGLIPKATLVHDISSQIAYSSLIENFGSDFIDGILFHLGLSKIDLSIQDNVNKIIGIINGEI